MLELLIFGALLGGSAINCGIKNAKSMSKPYRYLEDGTPVYLDRLAREHINGEEVRWMYDYKTKNTQLKGVNSGRVYEDRQKNLDDAQRARNEETKQRAIEFGDLAYLKEYPPNTISPVHNVFLTCEISTGKIITRLEGRADGTYWKYYLTDLKQYNNTITTKNGAFAHQYESQPVQITEDEYKKLDISCGSHTAMDWNHEYYDYMGRKCWKPKEGCDEAKAVIKELLNSYERND